MRYFRHLKYFHQSPIVKYSYDAASYVVFLLLFSYYLLFDFNVPKNTFPSIHWTEILVISIVTTMLIEEIRQVERMSVYNLSIFLQFLCQENRSMYGKVFNYFIANQFYNIINITSYSLFYIGLILRFTNTRTSEDFAAAKIVLAYDLEIWFIRSLAFLGIAQKLGPKLVMIRKMVCLEKKTFSSLFDSSSLDDRFIIFYFDYFDCHDSVCCCISNDASI